MPWLGDRPAEPLRFRGVFQFRDERQDPEQTPFAISTFLRAG